MWLIFTQTCLLACSWQLNSANKISWQVVFFLSCDSQDTVTSEIWWFTDKLIAEKSQVENFHWCMTKGRAGQGTSIQQRSYCSWNCWEKMSPQTGQGVHARPRQTPKAATMDTEHQNWTTGACVLFTWGTHGTGVHYGKRAKALWCFGQRKIDSGIQRRDGTPWTRARACVKKCKWMYRLNGAVCMCLKPQFLPRPSPVMTVWGMDLVSLQICRAWLCH